MFDLKELIHFEMCAAWKLKDTPWLRKVDDDDKKYISLNYLIIVTWLEWK